MNEERVREELRRQISSGLIQGAVVHGNDLVADRQTDAGAAGLGAALVKFLLDGLNII